MAGPFSSRRPRVAAASLASSAAPFPDTMIFRWDPCGLVCLVMTYGCVLYADYVVVTWIVLATPLADTLWGAFHVVLFNLVVFLLFMAHCRAVFSDPGLVPLPQHRIDFSDAHGGGGGGGTAQDKAAAIAAQADPPREDWTICTKCEMYRPPRAHHCRICGRCVRRMDHHCPWINNCVGEWNQKYFIQFLFYVGILSLYSVSLVGFSWYSASGCSSSAEIGGAGAQPKSDCAPQDLRVKQTRILHSVILVLESVLFGMFVVAIGCDQFEAIFTDETLVEQAKKQGPYRPRKPRMTLMAEVCGWGSPWLWPLPCQSVPRTVEPASNYEV